LTGVKLSLNSCKMNDRKTKRGAYRRDECVFIGAWIPVPLMQLVDTFVRDQDLDRSKLLRRALEEKIQPPAATPKA